MATPKRHPMVSEGRCTACHQPHGSNNRLLFAKDEISGCTECHKRHATFSHPVGAKAIDPRNKRELTCITCHDLMGSEFEFTLRFDRGKDLCLQCHKGY